MNYGLLAVASLRSKEAPFPLNNLPTPTTFKVHAMVLAHCMRFILKSLPLILKFHVRVISALILVASFARPKISSQFLGVSESLKFAKTSFIKIVNFCHCAKFKQILIDKCR